MNKMGIPQDCSKYLFRFLLCLIVISHTHKFLLSVVIDVDLKRPEMNQEFVVFKLKDIKGADGKSHKRKVKG
jgi:hypothetical protein